MEGPHASGNRPARGKNALPRRSLLGLAVLATAATMTTTLPASAQTPACKIAVIGDSLTAAYGLSVNEGFPARLQEALRSAGKDCAVIDAGVSGDTSAGGLTRIDWVLGDRPTHLIIELGANDGLRALPVDQLERNLDTIITKAKSAGVSVLLAGMLAPPNLGSSYGRAFAKVYRDLAERHDIALYPFFLDGVAGDRTLNLPDGIHPTAAGIDVIVDRMTPAVVEWLDAMS